MGQNSWADTVVSLTTILSTTLNSLANNTSDVSDTINNETDELIQYARYIDFELHLASLDLSAQVNPAIELYFLESIDAGTTFDQGDDATSDVDLLPAKPPSVIIPVRTGNGAEIKNQILTMIPLPRSILKILFLNKTGISLAASGNTLKYRTYNSIIRL